MSSSAAVTARQSSFDPNTCTTTCSAAETECFAIGYSYLFLLSLLGIQSMCSSTFQLWNLLQKQSLSGPTAFCSDVSLLWSALSCHGFNKDLKTRSASNPYCCCSSETQFSPPHACSLLTALCFFPGSGSIWSRRLPNPNGVPSPTPCSSSPGSYRCDAGTEWASVTLQMPEAR